MKKETYELVHLESIGLFFCEKTGLFYSDLYEGRQELSMPQFSIKKFMKNENGNWWFSGEIIEFFNYALSNEDYYTIVKCFIRLTTRR